MMDKVQSENFNIRFEKLGFKPQKEIIYNNHLPYSDKLDDDSNKMLKEIKGHLGRYIVLREIRPGCIVWVVRLLRYIKLYGLKFSKEDHILFIKITYEGLIIPTLEPSLMIKFANLLDQLLKKRDLISPDELSLPWRPLYELCLKISFSSETSLGMYRYNLSLESHLNNLVHGARFYFGAESTQDILDEFCPMLCPFDDTQMYSGVVGLEWYIPIALKPEQAHLGYKIWFNDIMKLWKTCHNAQNWEKEMMSLTAQLAQYNTGYIDWDSHTPLMFTRFQRSMNLPVSYKKTDTIKVPKMETTAIAIWIVYTLGGGSNTQDYLEKFMKTLESYFYPANCGRWLIRLKEFLRKLPFFFIARLHEERYKKISWMTPIPEEKKLTEEDITRFVECLKPVLMTALFSKLGAADISQAMNQLATLRPKLIIPPTIDLLYGALDTLTEPHRYIAALQCVAAVSRPMVESSCYPEGKNHVVPLLLAVLPGIDPNDMHKCFITFQFITAFSVMISFVDCSRAFEYWKDLTPEEEITCSSTAQMEDFVLQFLDRCFLLIENSSLENTRLEQDSDKRSKLENMIEGAIGSTCFSVLNQTSLPIFNTALQKLLTFLSGRILETKVAGRALAVICGAFTRVRPEVTLKLILPHVCDNIFSLSDSVDFKKEENLDRELLYNMLILSELLNSHGAKAIANYSHYIENVVSRTLHAKCKECHTSATNMLSRLFQNLSDISPAEFNITNGGVDKPIKDVLSIREWGKSGNLNNLNILWHYPNEKDLDEVQRLISKYIPPELEKLDNFVKDKIPLTREELKCSLSIINSVFCCGLVLPNWDEPPVKLIESFHQPISCSVYLGIDRNLTMPDGSNIKKSIINILTSLQEKILSTAEDDTKSLFSIITIWESILVYPCKEKEDYDSYYRNFLLTKKYLENKLIKSKKHLRGLLVERIKLQHLKRKIYVTSVLTETHKTVIMNLFNLATSHYSEIRIRAQAKLFLAINHYPYSYKILIPKIIENLQKDSNENHEVFKGSLYVLLGPKSNPIIARQDWDMLTSLWPVIIKTKPSEKLSVNRLLDMVAECVHKHFQTNTISLTIPQSFVDLGKKLWEVVPIPSLEMPKIEEENAGVIKLKNWSENNHVLYNDLLENINNAIINDNLHWRYHSMAMCFLRDLVHPEVHYPPSVASTFLNTLIHDALDLRKVAIRCTVFILKQQKRKHKKIDIKVEEMVELKKNYIESLASNEIGDCIYEDNLSIIANKEYGDRLDNKWLHYNYESRPQSEEQWNKPYYQHKRHIGYYSWPKVLKSYAPSDEQPSLYRSRCDLSPVEQLVYDFFIIKSNLDKLIQYLSLEEKKGKDKFNGFRFILFKSLFRNHGDIFLTNFQSHIENLILDKQESSQRCVAEIIAGLIRGSKHWPFKMVEQLWQFLTPIIKKALLNMTEETVVDWGICFATSAEKRDPNRQYWLLEILMEDPLRSESSFRDCGRLYALQGSLNQQDWKVAELFHRLLDYLKPHISHPFQNVRERIGSVLTNIFEMDLRRSETSESITRSPTIKDFIRFVSPGLEILYTISLEDSSSHLDKTDVKMESESIISKNDVVLDTEKEVALRLLKTVIRWIVSSLVRAHYSAISEFFVFFPLVCLMENYENDAEVPVICSSYLSSMSQSLTLEEVMPHALEAVFKTSELNSWWARETCLDFLQVFIFHNMAVINSNKEWISKISNLILKLLVDGKPEVRLKSSEVLSGLIHCGIISNDMQKQLLKTFRKQCNKDVKFSKYNLGNGLLERHSGVLGLCAFINSSPYDVPDYVPQIFLELGRHLNDPQPIPSTIRKTLSDFKRTHQDNWVQHKLKFTEDQLSVITDLIVPPSYYA